MPIVPAKKPRIALHRYRIGSPRANASAAVAPTEIRAHGATTRFKLPRRKSREAAIPPKAYMRLLIVSVMLTLPMPVPNSSAMGVKNNPEIFVISPSVAAIRPQHATTIDILVRSRFR